MFADACMETARVTGIRGIGTHSQILLWIASKDHWMFWSQEATWEMSVLFGDLKCSEKYTEHRFSHQFHEITALSNRKKKKEASLTSK